MKIFTRAALAAAITGTLLLLVGCAEHQNNFNDIQNAMNAETVTVSTGNIKGAKCILQNKKGHWKVTGTPQEVTIVRDYSDLVVRCKARGYLLGQKILQAEEFPFSQAYPRVICVKLHDKAS